MTTIQITILSTLGVLAIVGYFGTALSKSENGKLGYSFLSFFITVIFATIALILTQEKEQLSKKLNDKCPKYEKVEDVYRKKL